MGRHHAFQSTFDRRLTHVVTRAVIATIALAPAAMAQASGCSAASSSAFRQSAMATLPAQTPAQQTDPALWGVNDIPAQITSEQAAADQQTAAQQAADATKAALAAAAPTLVMPPAGGWPSGSSGGNAGNLGGSGSGSGSGSGGGGVANGPSIFSDNFSGGIDPNKWGVNYPWGKIQGDATQYAAYADSLNSDVFSTGANGLNIAIKPNALDGKPAETGQIYSKQAFQYGYVEMTATLPTTKGVGGAFWMMPTDGSGTYTELDMIESLGQDPGTVYSTIHDGGGQQQAAVSVPGGVQSPHTYGMDWQPDTTTFYRDGQVTQSFRTPDSAKKPMYIILSVNSTPGNSPSPWGQAIDPGNVSANYNVRNVRVLPHAP